MQNSGKRGVHRQSVPATIVLIPWPALVAFALLFDN
jgi:hypothetical protein